MDKKDAFNLYAGYALGLLDDALPGDVKLVPSKIVRELGHEENKQNIYICERTLSWLRDEGLFRCPATYCNSAETWFPASRLTTAGFAALNEKIDFRGSSQRIGDVLSDQAKHAGAAARDAVIAELVGKKIGAATRAFVGN